MDINCLRIFELCRQNLINFYSEVFQTGPAFPNQNYFLNSSVKIAKISHESVSALFLFPQAILCCFYLFLREIDRRQVSNIGNVRHKEEGAYSAFDL